jgi:glycosyltransferase involved in cell wall biosynthesis
MRGGEKVLRSLCDLFPDAVIFTHVANERLIKEHFAGHEVRRSFISKLPFSQSHSEQYLPLMPLALEELDVLDFDLVISSEAGPAKGIIPRPDAFHLCYCHSPMRYIWDKYHIYKRQSGLVGRALFPPIAHALRQWDVSSAARVDQFVANSKFVAKRIEKYYRRDADVIYPPVSVDKFSPLRAAREEGAFKDAYLWVGQLAPYKSPSVAVEAFSRMKRRLVVIGEGNEKRRLQRMAGETITFLDRVDFDVLCEAYASAKALVYPGEEDFGIAPVEAMASGTPVVAYGRGGAVETVRHKETGWLYDNPEIDGLIEAVEEFERIEGDFRPLTLQAHARKFSEESFKANMTSLLVRCGAPVRRTDIAFQRPGQSPGAVGNL